MSEVLRWSLLAGLVLVVLLAISLRVVMEYERGVVFRLGRVIATRGSGLITGAWGVKVTFVEVKDVELPDTMRRAMARQAEAERDRRAKVIHAAGEFEAAGNLGRAAEVLEEHPAALQLRVLSTMAELTSERSSTLVFPLPTELLRLIDTLNHKFSDPATTADRANATPVAAATADVGNQPSDPGSPRVTDDRRSLQTAVK